MHNVDALMSQKNRFKKKNSIHDKPERFLHAGTAMDVKCMYATVENKSQQRNCCINQKLCPVTFRENVNEYNDNHLWWS